MLDPFFGNTGDPQSLHKYLYAHGDPINATDPSGLMSVGSMMCSIGTAIKVGAVNAFTLYSAYSFGANSIQALNSFYQGNLLGGLYYSGWAALDALSIGAVFKWSKILLAKMCFVEGTEVLVYTRIPQSNEIVHYDDSDIQGNVTNPYLIAIFISIIIASNKIMLNKNKELLNSGLNLNIRTEFGK
jgi:hypothetical protein